MFDPILNEINAHKKNYANETSEPIDMKESSKKNKSKKPLIFVLLVIALFMLLNSMYTVKENEYAYVTRFSKMVDAHDNAGLNFKIPLIDSVNKIPTYQMIYDIPPSEVITADKKTLVIDNFAIWKIDDPYTFIKTLRGSISEMEGRISASVYSEVKNEFGRLMREEIISTDPTSVEKVSDRVTEKVNKSLSSYGISITSVKIKKTDLPEDNANSVYSRMIAERDRIAATYLAEGQLEGDRIRNDVNKQVAIIQAEAEADANKRRGEAEAKYMEIMASAYSNPDKAAFYKFLRSLDALETSFSDTDTVLVLDEDSDIVKALLNK